MSGVCEYTYDKDSDLESDSDEDACDTPATSDSITGEPKSKSHSRALSPTNTSDPDIVQSALPASPSGEKAASNFDIDADSPSVSATSHKNSPTKNGSHVSLYYSKSDSIFLSEYENAEVSPICDESMSRSAEVINHRVEDYLANRAEPEEKAPHLALVNDVAFRTSAVIDVNPFQFPSLDSVYVYQGDRFRPAQIQRWALYNVSDACSPKSMYRLAVKVRC